MNNNKYSIGIDFGTESARAALVEIDTGKIISVETKKYTHGVMDEYICDGKVKLGHDWALQHPKDYLEILYTVIPSVLSMAGIKSENVIAIAVDFTSCTLLPVDKDYIPLCFKDEFRMNPHSYAKLWKHHAAQSEASILHRVALEKNENFLKRYSGNISSEWLVPKVLQVLNEDPEIYSSTYKFMEAGDWITLMLTGKDVRNSCATGYKAFWNKKEGYPSNEFFKAVDLRLENVVSEKLSQNICPAGSRAGELTVKMANKVALKPGTIIGTANVDAHAAFPAAGITKSGEMLIIIGTSACHLVLDSEEKIIPGICGVVEDGIIPGYFGYEAGQPAVGDIFEWFIENSVPQRYIEEASSLGIDIHNLLSEKAAEYKPGESGLLALDWWNGNRSVLCDSELSGLILGYNLSTKPEEVYRALIEATAFGTRRIIEMFEENGIVIKSVCACGGIAEKNTLAMQIYADIINRNIRIPESTQTAAVGSAMFAAVAAGKKNGGYDSILEAAKHMAKTKEKYYKPISENVEVYNILYREYKRLYDYFGKGTNDAMKTLKSIRHLTSLKK